MVQESMRGEDQQENHIFSYLSLEARVRKDHRLRSIRVMVDEVLGQLSQRFDTMYAHVGRPSIAPAKLLRAQVLQMLYSIRSERLLMEEMDYNLLFRWFVGRNADEEVWDATTPIKNRDRLLGAEVAKDLARVVAQRKSKRIEECFGWLKTIALLRKLRHRGVCKVHWIFTLACAAYDLVRMRNLTAAVSAV
jgi:transposase